MKTELTPATAIPKRTPPDDLATALEALDRSSADVLSLIALREGYRISTHPSHADLCGIELAVQELRVALRDKRV